MIKIYAFEFRLILLIFSKKNLPAIEESTGKKEDIKMCSQINISYFLIIQSYGQLLQKPLIQYISL
jgi:hypothetical protein